MVYQLVGTGAARGPRGADGRDGLPGVNAVPADTAVAAYYDDPESLTYAAAQAATDAQVEQALETYAPGTELGYASRATTFTTTNTASNLAAGNITGLSVTFTGQGRPVDLRFQACSVYHSVANTHVSVVLLGNAGVTDPNNQIGAVASTLTTTGPSLVITRRTGVLTAGVSYTFLARAWAAAGTSTFVAASYCPLELTVTSR